MKKMRLIAVLTPALLLGACVTTRPTSAQVESCRAMEGNMGLQTPHDHGEMKGQGRNPMNLSHDRCLQILRNAQRQTVRPTTDSTATVDSVDEG